MLLSNETVIPPTFLAFMYIITFSSRRENIRKSLILSGGIPACEKYSGSILFIVQANPSCRSSYL